MAEGTSKSEYYSQYTESAERTVFSSDLGDFDVFLCYHDNSNLKDPVRDAKDILETKGFTAKHTIDATLTAGKPIAEYLIRHAKCSKYRVFLINKAFLKHEMMWHGSILFNSDISTKENTVILARPIHQKKIPDNAKHVTIVDLSPRISGEEIAEKVIKFINENKPQTQTGVQYHTTMHQPSSGNRSQEFDKKKQLFAEMMDNFTTKRAFVLCACVKPTFPYVCSLSVIPWLKVFDFDSESESEGLLKMAKQNLISGKFSISNTSEKPLKSSDAKTDWTIVKMTNENSSDALSSHISSLSNFCAGRKPATMLIIWYRESDDDLEDSLRDFVSNVNHDFKLPRKIKFVLCLAEVPDVKNDIGRISKKYANDFRIIAPLEKICEWIPEIAANRIREMQVHRLILPKLKDEDDTKGTFTLEESNMNWLLTDLHVLALDESDLSALSNNEKVTQHGEDFLKGSDLTWDVIEDGSYDVRRDIQQSIIDFLTFQCVGTGQSGIVTLFHSPGSGGSTIGRRVLWDLRKNVPCLELLPKTEIEEDFREKIKMVREGSNLPILLLVDGRSCQEVRNILDICRYERLIILHILRYYPSSKKPPKANGVFFLQDALSKIEAKMFEKILLKHGNAGIRRKLAVLTAEVEEGGQHTVFEYGLAAFHSEFRGVQRYVESHLVLHNGLQPWHKVAAFLSLANYYGNCDIPSEFFSEVFSTSSYISVDLEKDVPELGQQFIRECADDSNWKISHFIVAKEILYQYLEKAKISLDELSIEFLHCARNHLIDPCIIPQHILRILNNVFIIRHSEDAYENDDYKTKTKYSRLILDVGDDSKQKLVFKTLTELFPKNSEFFAHYGRFLGKINQHSEAVVALKEAVRIQEDLNRRTGKNASEFGDEVLYRIHSMFGYAYNAHVRHIFGNISVGFMVASKYSKLSPKDLLAVRDTVVNAIDQFKKCRSYYCPSVSPSYGYVGELQIRLYLTEFCKKITRHNIGELNDRNHKYHFLRDMIRDSFFECEFLLDQFIKTVDDTKVVQKEIIRYFNLFNDYFTKSIHHLERWAWNDETISSKRYNLALLKIQMKSDKNREFRVFEDMRPNSQSVDKLLQALEKILDHKEYMRIRISSYMEDWLRAIRISGSIEKYSVNRIMQYIEKWDEKQEKESLSTLYNYILHFVLAFSTHNPNHIKRLNGLRQELENRHRMLPKSKLEKPIEWIIGIHQKSNCPLAILQHCQQENSPKQLCRGHVVEAYVWRGYIELRSLGKDQIRVFFVPNKFKIKPFHAKERCLVEFTIGFNPKHGAQAYNVQIMEYRVCPQCNVTFEISKRQPSICPSCHTTYSFV